MLRSAIALAAGLVVLTLLGWIFGETTEAVIRRDDIAALDDPVTRWLVARRTPWLTQAMQSITELGSAWVIVPLLVVVTGIVVTRSDARLFAWVPVVSAAGAALLVLAVKLAIARPRPTIGEIVAAADGFSFPSGHSAQAVATYGALAWVATRLAQGVPRWRFWGPAAVLAALIGFSRLYLGVHWLSDVVGGFTLGAAWLVLTVGALTAGRLRARIRGARVGGPSPPDA